MSAHVLLNLLNEFVKKIDARLNNTGARMQVSVYHMTQKLHFICVFRNKTSRFSH